MKWFVLLLVLLIPAVARAQYGACPSGATVTGLNGQGPPTCTPIGNLAAPLTNPAGGANNYAPLANPTFTGTVTLPDTSTVTSTGNSKLTVTGITSLASTTINSNPMTVGSATQAADLYTGGTLPLGTSQISSFIGIGTKGPQIQLVGPSSSAAETAEGQIVWGSPANPIGTPVGAGPTSAGRVSASINVTAGGASVQPSGGFQFQTAPGDGTSAKTSMELARDGTLILPFYTAAGGFMGGPGTINIAGSYYINGKNQFRTGTWTPVQGCSGGNPTFGGLSGNVGYWTTIGNMLFYQTGGVWSTATGGSGASQLQGLPFPAIDTSGDQGSLGWRGDIVISNATPSNAGNTRILATVANGSSVVQLHETNFGTTGYLTPLPCANAWPNTPSGYWINGYYRYQ